jgi:hypothetical protein
MSINVQNHELYDSEAIGLWDDNEECGATKSPHTASFPNGQIENSDHNMIVMLSMTEVEMDYDRDDLANLMYDDHDDIDEKSTRHEYGIEPVKSSRFVRQLPSFYGDDYDDKYNDEYDDGYGSDCIDESEYDDEISDSHVSIRTPPQDDPHAIMFPHTDYMHEVTPKTSHAPIIVQFSQLSDINHQVQRSLKKFACSMRRSDETRTMIKRQKIQQQPQQNANTNKSIEFEIEERRRVYNMIQIGLSATSTIGK